MSLLARHNGLRLFSRIIRCHWIFCRIRGGSLERLEAVLQSELDLAHRDGGAGDRSEAARKHVRVRNAPDGVVQDVERFETELQHVAFLIRHAEFLVGRGVDREESRTDQSVPAGVAEGAGNVGGERGRDPTSATATGLSMYGETPVAFGRS